MQRCLTGKLNINRPLLQRLLIGNLLIVILLQLNGCAGLFNFPTYFDPTTYKNLTNLKAEVSILYETFLQDESQNDKIDSANLGLAQAHEYEKGKGVKNIETAKQIEIIIRMFKRHIKDRKENGTWSNEHSTNSRQNIEAAFDIAIETERLKNKNE